MNIITNSDYQNIRTKEIRNICLYLFMFALAIRGVYCVGFTDNPLFDYVSPAFDQINFDNGAIGFANGDIMARGGAEGYAPLYKYFLGIIYFVFGRNFYAVWAVQFTIGAISSVFMFLVTIRFFNKWVGIISSVFYAMYSQNIYYEGCLIRASLTEFFAVVLFYFLLKYREDTRLKYLVLSATFLSLIIQCRPNTLFLIPFCLYYVYTTISKISPVKIRIKHLLIFLGLLVIIGAPLMVRTVIVHKKFALYATSGPQPFLIGNVPEYEGVGWDDLESINKTKSRVKDPNNYVDVSSYVLRRFISSPIDYIKLYGRKIYWFFNSYEFPANTNYYVYQEFSNVLKNPLGNFSLLASLAVVGIFLAGKDYKRLLLIYFFLTGLALSVIVLYPTSRFRMPIVPFFMIFASYAFFYIFQNICKRKIILPLSCVMFVTLMVYLLKTPDSYNHKIRPIDYNNLAAAYFQNENRYSPEKVEEYCIKSWNLNNKINSKRMAVNNRSKKNGEKTKYIVLENTASDTLSRVYIFLLSKSFANKNYKEAITFAKKAIKLDYSNVKAHRYLGQCYIEGKNFEKAINEFKICIMIEPQNADDYYNLFALYYNLQDYFNCVTYYQKALRIEPDIIDANNTNWDKLEKSMKKIESGMQQNIERNYGKIEMLWNATLEAVETGQFEIAISNCKQILAIAHGNIGVRNGLAFSYAKSGNFEDSISEYINVLTLNPYLAEIHYNLYELYNKHTKHRLKAMFHLEQTLEIDPGQENHYKLRENLNNLKFWAKNLRQISFD